MFFRQRDESHFILLDGGRSHNVQAVRGQVIGAERIRQQLFQLFHRNAPAAAHSDGQAAWPVQDGVDIRQRLAGCFIHVTERVQPVGDNQGGGTPRLCQRFKGQVDGDVVRQGTIRRPPIRFSRFLVYAHRVPVDDGRAGPGDGVGRGFQFPPELPSQEVHSQGFGNVGSRGDYRLRSDGLGDLLGQMVGASQVAGKDADGKTARVVHADQRRIPVLVPEERGCQPDCGSYGQEQHNGVGLVPHLPQHGPQGKVKGKSLAGFIPESAFQVEGGVRAQSSGQAEGQGCRLPGKGDDRGAGHGHPG